MGGHKWGSGHVELFQPNFEGIRRPGFEIDLEGVHHPADHHVETDEKNEFNELALVIPFFDSAEDLFWRCCVFDDSVREDD